MSFKNIQELEKRLWNAADELDTSILLEDEQDLLNYWSNGHDFL